MTEEIKYGRKTNLIGSVDIGVIEQLKANAVKNQHSVSKEMELTLLKGMNTPEFIITDGVYFHLTLEELDMIRQYRIKHTEKKLEEIRKKRHGEKEWEQ